MSFDEDAARLRAAFADGKLSGLDREADETACPFDGTEPMLQGAWRDGFMIGLLEAQIWTGKRG